MNLPPSILSLQDLQVGSVLGRGSFASVYQVKLSNTDCTSLKKTCFAMKKLQERTMSAEERETASEDMQHEARILKKLPSHDHIIQLHAVSYDFWGMTSGGFLILECLAETLQDRLDKWRQQRKSISSSFALFESAQSKSSRKRRQELDIQQTALPIARAMSFLHKHKILYRDLKPRNVGYNAQGTIRLFDFGLSRDLEGQEDRKMTLMSGTVRYMAPEVLSLSDSYGLEVDVYSYTVLLWEIVTHRLPYRKCKSVKSAKEAIADTHTRPNLGHVLDKSVKNLLQQGWHKDPSMRPGFQAILHELESLFEVGSSDSPVLRDNQKRVSLGPRKDSLQLARNKARASLAGAKTASFATLPEKQDPRDTKTSSRPGLAASKDTLSTRTEILSDNDWEELTRTTDIPRVACKNISDDDRVCAIARPA
jgi:serine/threonine protein kinase